MRSTRSTPYRADRRRSSFAPLDRDNDVGVDAGEPIFDAFVTNKRNGMGMGLAICRSVAHAHGGEIWAEPQRPAGSMFGVLLPASGGVQ